MTAPPTTTTRMALRKREAPPTSLTMQRDALISCFKRSRAADSETDTLEEADTESDYEDARSVRTASKPVAGRRVGKPPRQVEPTNATDKVLTFLQTAQQQNYPVRSGKWNDDEEAYLRKLVQVFNSGVLDHVESKTSMRMWLAKMLHCCPMRISKKQMHGEKFKGKSKYTRNADRIERMSQKEFDRTCQELHQLRYNFLKFWAREEFNRWSSSDSSRDFGEWYEKVVRNVPKPSIAKNARLVASKVVTTIEPWAIFRQNIEAAAQMKVLEEQERGLQRRLSQRENGKRSPEPAGFSPSQQQQLTLTTLSQAVRRPVATLDYTAAVSDTIFEPIPNTSPADDVDLVALVNQWDDDSDSTVAAATHIKPVNVPPLEDVYTPEQQLSPGIVLDFGPPSLWDIDSISKEASSPDHCEWVDDLLADNESLVLDLAVLTPCDMTTEQWLQQLSTTFQF